MLPIRRRRCRATRPHGRSWTAASRSSATTWWPSAFWHLSRWEERPGSSRDRHGRFAAAFSAADPESPAVDALLRRFQEVYGAQRRPGFRVVLSHDIDEPWHWHGRSAVRVVGVAPQAGGARAPARGRPCRGRRARRSAVPPRAGQRPDVDVPADARGRGPPRRTVDPLPDRRPRASGGRSGPALRAPARQDRRHDRRRRRRGRAAPELHGERQRHANCGGAPAGRGRGRACRDQRPLPLPAPRDPPRPAAAGRTRLPRRLDAGLRRPAGPPRRVLAPLPPVRPGPRPPAGPARGAAGGDGRDVAGRAPPGALGGGRTAARDRRARAGRPERRHGRGAVAQQPVRAGVRARAGIGSTTDCWPGCARAAASWSPAKTRRRPKSAGSP